MERNVLLVSTDAREGGTRDESWGKSAGEATQVLDVALSQKNLFMLLAVRLLSYGCTREVWTALKLLEVRSAIALCNFYASFVLSKPPACDIGTLSMNKFLNILNAQILTKIAAVLLLDRHIYMKHGLIQAWVRIGLFRVPSMAFTWQQQLPHSHIHSPLINKSPKRQSTIGVLIARAWKPFCCRMYN